MGRASNGKTAPQKGLISVDEKERTRLRVLREARDLTQGDLARSLRHRVSSATISNFETMRHPQVERQLYADIKWALERAGDHEDEGETYQAIVDGLTGMDMERLRTVLAVVGSLKKSR